MYKIPFMITNCFYLIYQVTKNWPNSTSLVRCVHNRLDLFTILQRKSPNVTPFEVLYRLWQVKKRTLNLITKSILNSGVSLLLNGCFSGGLIDDFCKRLQQFNQLQCTQSQRPHALVSYAT